MNRKRATYHSSLMEDDNTNKGVNHITRFNLQNSVLFPQTSYYIQYVYRSTISKVNKKSIG